MIWLAWLPYGTLALSLVYLAVSIWAHHDIKRRAQQDRPERP